MRRLRELGKIANEPYTEPDSITTKDIKKALNKKIPTEIDFYISDAEHEIGTNKYTFKFPPEWRTVINADLIFGVRGIYVNNDVKYISVMLKSFTKMKKLLLVLQIILKHIIALVKFGWD